MKIAIYLSHFDKLNLLGHKYLFSTLFEDYFFEQMYQRTLFGKTYIVNKMTNAVFYVIFQKNIPVLLLKKN